MSLSDVVFGAINMEVLNGVNDGAQKGLGDPSLWWGSDTSLINRGNTTPEWMPWFLDHTTPSNLTGRSDTQACMDKRLEQGFRCGLGYIAHNFACYQMDYFAAGVGAQSNITNYWHLLGINSGMDLHMTSDKRTLVKACVNLAGASQLLPVSRDVDGGASWATYVIPKLVTFFSDPGYMKVGGQPLVYIYNPAGQYGTADVHNFADATAMSNGLIALRNASNSAGAGAPYYVGLSGGGEDISATVSNLGLHAAGDYTAPAASGTPQTAASFHSAQAAAWPALTTRYGASQIVTATVAHDNRRVFRPTGNASTLRDGTTPSGYGDQANDYSTAPTPTEWKNHAYAAAVRADAHSTIKHVLINALGEQDIFPWLEPCPAENGMFYQFMAQKMARQRENVGALRNRGIQMLSR